MESGHIAWRVIIIGISYSNILVLAIDVNDKIRSLYKIKHHAPAFYPALS
jgi:hypothetical protein